MNKWINKYKKINTKTKQNKKKHMKTEREKNKRYVSMSLNNRIKEMNRASCIFSSGWFTDDITIKNGLVS